MKISIGDILRGYTKIFSEGQLKIKRNVDQTSRRTWQDLSQEFHEYEAGKEINIDRVWTK
jgi:hypothetical protein